MSRLAATVLFLGLALSATAADPPRGPDLAPTIHNCTVRGEQLVYVTYEHHLITKMVKVVVEQDGKRVEQDRAVTEAVAVPVQKTVALKGLRATDGGGKPIAADRLATLLGDETPVVFHTGPLAAKYRGLFRDATVLIEFPPVPANVIPEKMVPPSAPKPLSTKSKD